MNGRGQVEEVVETIFSGGPKTVLTMESPPGMSGQVASIFEDVVT
jgi:hypothetical protein